MLDAILFPLAWEARYHFYDPTWAPGERVFSMRDGLGDFYFVWFSADGGAVLRGFGEDSPMSPWSWLQQSQGTRGKPWPGLFDGLPPELETGRSESAFGGEKVTFCAWWIAKHWHVGVRAFPDAPDPDGSARMLFALGGDPGVYARWASEHTSRCVSEDAVAGVHAGQPLDDALVAALNPGATLADVRDEASSIGYPIASG